MTLTDSMYQEKRVEEDLPALKTALKHRYKDSKTIYKNNDKGRITAIGNDTDKKMQNQMATRKQTGEGKQLYRRFKQLINISHD